MLGWGCVRLATVASICPCWVGFAIRLPFRCWWVLLAAVGFYYRRWAVWYRVVRVVDGRCTEAVHVRRYLSMMGGLVVLVVPTTVTHHRHHHYAMSYDAVVGIWWSLGLGVNEWGRK